MAKKGETSKKDPAGQASVGGKKSGSNGGGTTRRRPHGPGLPQVGLAPGPHEVAGILAKDPTFDELIDRIQENRRELDGGLVE